MQHAPGSAGLSTIGKVLDHGDGTYSVPIASGFAPSADVFTDRFEVVIDDGLGEITLFPYPKVNLKPPLSASRPDLSAAAGGALRFDLKAPASAGGRPFVVLASATGKQPGLATSSLHIPLNPDAVFWSSLLQRAGSGFEGAAGTLTGAGDGTAWFEAAPGLLAPLVGSQLDFAFVTLDPIDFVSNPATVTISP